MLQCILDSVTFLRFCLQDIKYSFMIEIFHPPNNAGLKAGLH